MIRPLTSLRFVFAFMVLCAHSPFYTDSRTFGYKLSALVMSEGFIGVSFFFILSGFILSLNYADAFRDESVSKRDFWIMRFARIYPLYLLTLLIEIPFTMHEYHAHAGIWWGRLATCAVMLQSWVPDIQWTAAFNMPSWSLSVEAFFYALFPLLIIRIRKVRTGVLLSAAAMLILLTGMYFTPPSWYKVIFYNNPLGRLGEFVLGIALYRYYEAHRSKSWTYRYATRMELGAIVIFLLFFVFHLWVPHVLRFSVYYWVPMVFLLYVFSRSSGAVSRLLSRRLFVLAGEASFAFYMIHYRVGGMLSIANRRLHIDQASLLYFLLYFGITLVGSVAVYLLFERPANRYLRQKLLPKRRLATALSHSTTFR
jgi:peptidoglycan/LPS O-acetylase OafA/YrhL